MIAALPEWVPLDVTRPEVVIETAPTPCWLTFIASPAAVTTLALTVKSPTEAVPVVRSIPS